MLPPQVDSGDASLVPPTEMLHDGSSSAEEFILLGETFCQCILMPRTHLLPSASVFDLGCGNGGVARALARFLSPSGRYEGVDVNAATIKWLQEHYGAYSNFRFTHADVYNKAYNAGGRLSASEYRFPFADASFDLSHGGTSNAVWKRMRSALNTWAIPCVAWPIQSCRKPSWRTMSGGFAGTVQSPAGACWSLRLATGVVARPRTFRTC